MAAAWWEMRFSARAAKTLPRMVYVRDGVEFAGKRGKLGGELFGFEELLFFAGVEDAESRMALLAGHAAGAAIGELAETLVAAWIEGI